jgi:protein-S-isoprenylcysteine O-methyltransferase Ste14
MAQKLRVPLGFVIAAAVLYLAQPTRISFIVGIPIALAGMIFRTLAAGVIKKDSTLATSGIYGLTRNPLYFGSALLASGFAIISANQLAAALLLLPFMIIYPTVMLREEAHLARLFPDEFRLYKAKVPRFFPRLTLRSRLTFSFGQYVSNREYDTAMGFAAALGFMFLKWWLI